MFAARRSPSDRRHFSQTTRSGSSVSSSPGGDASPHRDEPGGPRKFLKWTDAVTSGRCYPFGAWDRKCYWRLPRATFWAATGHYIGQAVGWYQAGQGAGFIASVVGALVLLFIYGALKKKTA